MEEGRSVEDDFADVRRVAALITYLFSLLKDRVLIAEVNADDMEEMQTLVEILHDKNEHIVIGLFDCSKDGMIISFCVPKEFEPLLTNLYLILMRNDIRHNMPDVIHLMKRFLMIMRPMMRTKVPMGIRIAAALSVSAMALVFSPFPTRYAIKTALRSMAVVIVARIIVSHPRPADLECCFC